MLASLLIIVLSLMNSALGQEEELCAPFDNILEASQYYCTSNFPSNIFNVDCLLSSCPSLKGVCPLTSDKKVNQTALTSAVSVLNECIAQNSLVCNYNMSHISMADLSWTTAQLIPPKVANGTVVLNSGSGYVENLSKATFTVLQNEDTNGPIILTIGAPNFISVGYYNCTFNFPLKSILRSLRGIIPDLNSLNTPNAKCVLRVNVTSTVSFDLTTPTPTVKTIDQQFDLNIFFSNFVNCDGKELEPSLVNAFNKGMNSIVKASVVPSAIIDFLSAYAAKGFQAAQSNCP